MTVTRRHTFTLDDATLSGGAAIVAAGSGLPRRITGAIDYEARVLALNPSGYWPLNETSGSFLDRTANAQHLTYANGTRGVTGAGPGGSAGAAFGAPSSTTLWGASADAAHAAHVPTNGVPFTVAGWFLWPEAYSLPANGTTLSLVQTGNVSPASAQTTPGFRLGADAGGTVYGGGLVFEVRFSGLTARKLTLMRYGAPFAQRWIHVVAFYTGGDPTLGTSYRMAFDGEVISGGNLLGTSAISGSALALNLHRATTTNSIPRMQHLAIWATSQLDAAQIATLATPACGRALWTLPSAAAERTLKGVQLPGVLARSDSTRVGVRARYDVGAGEVEFDPGDDLNVTIPAGQSVSLIADLTHYHLDDLPWIGDSLGGGPTAILEESDPAVDITSISSSAGQIEMQFSSQVGSVASPVSGPRPAVQISGTNVSGSLLTLDVDYQLPIVTRPSGSATYDAPPPPPQGIIT